MIQTLCPACGTAFRVTPEQLKAKQGRVRCGNCRHVFNAIETLIDAKTAPAPISPIASQPEFSVMEESAAEMSLTPKATPAPTSAVPVAEVEPSWQEIEPLLHEEPEIKPRRRSWPWALAALLTLLVLLLQAMVQFRVELGVLSPQIKPLLLALCKPLDCDLPLPHKADLVGIESSDLHPDPLNKEQLVMAATLKNRAPFVQAYPHLELTLTDNADKAVLRKVLTPVDYLDKQVSAAAGFAANGEIAVNMVLGYSDPESALATGYRLYLFYP